ncbi:MAG: endonuclease/exonuclease/phosphatase family protein [Phycisphaerae bacterium]
MENDAHSSSFKWTRWVRGHLLVVLVIVGLHGAALPRTVTAYDPLNGDYSKQDTYDVRVVSYNTQKRFIASPSRDAAFERVLTVLSPDIIVFQEIPPSVGSDQIKVRLDDVLPIDGASWHVHMGRTDGFNRNVVASRFPLSLTRVDTVPISELRGVTIALVDLPDEQYVNDVYILGVHLKCCGGTSEDARRQISADAIANWLGDARGEQRPRGDHVVLVDETPMVVVGDFNLVGPSNQPEITLIEGDIQNQGTYGPPVKGDWDDSDMNDLHPADPFTGDTDTWSSNTANPTSRLDRFIYTDSVAIVVNSFILNTLTMSSEARSALGLLLNDTTSGSTADHLPIAMDLRLHTDCNENGVPDLKDIINGDSADCNRNETPDECEPSLPADFEGDNDVDLWDFTVFTDCVGGPDSPPLPTSPACLHLCLDRFDLDADGDVDLHDLALLLQLFTG